MSLMNNLRDGILKCLEEDRKYNYTSELCNYIYEKKINLNKIIEIIGSYLTSTDRIRRLKAIDFLYNLVLNIKSNGFTNSEVNYLTEFFIGRLTDNYLIPCEITQTIHLLIIKWNIDDELIKKLIIAIKQVEINQQNSEIRFQFYKIIGHILKHKLTIVKSINSEFVFLFLQSIDGEKDPRCLLLVFDLFVFLNQNLDTKCYEEELFEVVGCYFPIMYNPPKEVNKLHITKENLAERLFLCLTCNKGFTPFLLQLLIDKFETPVEEIKIYCFQVLNQILIDGDYKLFAKYQNDFWNIIKFDCLKRSKTNQNLNNYIEQCLKLLTKVYSSENDLIKKWFKMIINDLEACLFNLELNCYLPSTMTLTILGISYPNYFNIISRLLISNSIHNYNTNKESKYRIEALQSLFVFSEEIKKNKEFKFNQNQQFTEDYKSLLSKISQEKIELLNDYNRLISIFDYLICFLFDLILKNDTINDDERLNCFISLRSLLLLEIEFDNQLIENYLNQLFKLIKKYQDPKYLEETSKILEHFSNTKSDLVQQTFIENLLNELNSTNFIKLLKFCKLNLEQEKKFINYSLDCLKKSNINSDLIDTIGDTLKKHFQNNQTKNFLNLFFDYLMQPLVDLIFKNLNDKEIRNENIILSLITEICRYLDLDRSKEIQTFIFILFTTETIKKLPKNCFLNIEIQFNNDSLLFLKLMESILISLKIQNTDKEELKLVYTKLFDKLIITKDLEIFQTLINLIEICTAKFENTKSIINSLNYLNDNYDNQTLRIRYLLVKFYISILKSFITIGDDQSEFIIKKLIKILIREKNLDICKQAIIGIKYIHESDLKLIEQNHVKCKSFLNQRFYYLMIPLLIKEYNYLETEDALNNLILIESEEQSKNEYNQLIKQSDLTNNIQAKKVYTRTDSFVVKMITNIENKIAAEKETDNQLINSQSLIQNSSKANQFDIDPIKKTLQLRKNLISNVISLKINYLPKAMVKIEIKKLQKIILKNYLNLKELDDCDVLVNNQINFLKLILEYNSKLLEDNLLELINFLIKFLNLPQSNMHTKCKILNCLELIAKSNLKPFEIVKLKSDVIKNIKIMLDYKKRLVRYAAVSSISRWIMI